MAAAFQAFYAWITSTVAGKAVVSAVVSMLPVIELRGGIPIAIGLGLSVKSSILICVLANCIPILPILLVFRRVLELLRARGGGLTRFANWMETHATKHRDTLDKYAAFGLCILTAIPLPGTGAWTASMLAAIMQVPVRLAAPAITVGVIGAGIIVSVVSYGVVLLV